MYNVNVFCGQLFRFFQTKIFWFAVALCDLVHDVNPIQGLL